jgi:hypothetical protein
MPDPGEEDKGRKVAVVVDDVVWQGKPKAAHY